MGAARIPQPIPRCDNCGFVFIEDYFTNIEKINSLSNDSEEYNNMQLVKLDFLRRLSLFSEAQILIENIRNNKNLY